ncbi:MAG: class I SAM-dependent methyltransferase [Acidimicrobiales bacterium]
MTVRDVPVMCGVLWDTRAEAATAARGDIDLVACPSCSMLRNAAYDDGLIGYQGIYDNSLHFSPTFERYAEELARRLVERHDLRGRSVLEVGSGKGDFLRLLCRLGGNRGWGYDPTYAGEQDDAAEQVTFIPEYFSGAVAATPDLVCLRHVLEHLAEPARMLQSIHLASNEGTVLYAEVPDASYVLTPAGLWDVIYPHVGYFTATALRHLVEGCGFAPTAFGTSFGGQFLWTEARATDGQNPVSDPSADEVAEVLDLAAGFAQRHRDTLERWAERLDHASRVGQRLALWGAGAKGVTFLNVVPGGAGIADVVDVNPRKRGRFVPGTGQAVIGPDDLAQTDPDLVIIMNPNYHDEIRGALAGSGLDTAIAVV